MKVIPTHSKTWDITLDVVFLKYENHWSNIFHFTRNGDREFHGDRNPAFFFKDTQPLICFAATGYTTYHSMLLPAVSLNTKYGYRFRQYQNCPDCIYKFEITIDGNIFATHDNEFPIQYNNVKFYLSDPWFVEPPVIVSNFVYTQY